MRYATAFLIPALLVAQAPADEATKRAIQITALDYIEGWYEGDAARMERALHPDLAKRVQRTSSDGRGWVDHMSALSLIQETRKGFGKKTPPEKRQKDVQILDVFGKAATVKVTATDWVDYLHLTFLESRWVIVNVLWEPKPKA